MSDLRLEPLIAAADAGPSPELADMTRRFWIGLALALPVFLLEMGGHLIPALHHLVPMHISIWIQFALATPVVLWAGWPFFARGWASIVNRSLNMFTLIAMGTGVAWGYSIVATFAPQLFPQAFRDADGAVAVNYEAAAVITVLVLLGQVMELRAREQTSGAIRALLNLAPKTARRIGADGVEEDVPVEAIAIGERLRVRPGETVPVDGVVEQGRSSIDESMVTGESMPVTHVVGEAVVGGTLTVALLLLWVAEADIRDSVHVGLELVDLGCVTGKHCCIYCYARPSHAWMGLSPGLDFESRIFFKPEAAGLLEQSFLAPRYRCKRIHIGGNTDPYQPVERTLNSTRSILEVMQRFNHPFSIITKSVLIARDADILGPMGKAGLASAFVSITTLDRKLARAMEPRASTPAKRLEAIRRLADAGCPVGVGFAPVIPGLNDHELEAVLEAAAKAGATTAMYVTLRLPLEIKDLFREWLADARPDRAARVMSLVRQTRGGRDYDPDWSQRMKGTGPVAELIGARFKAAIKRYGLDGPRTPLDETRFRVPADARPQLDLFDLPGAQPDKVA